MSGTNLFVLCISIWFKMDICIINFNQTKLYFTHVFKNKLKRSIHWTSYSNFILKYTLMFIRLHAYKPNKIIQKQVAEIIERVSFCSLHKKGAYKQVKFVWNYHFWNIYLASRSANS